MHLPSEVAICKDNVVFIAKSDLCLWVQAQSGNAYWFFELESIIANILPTVVSGGRRVELYAVPNARRLYAKIFSGESTSQQEWTLHYTDGGVMWLSRLS